MSPMMKILFWVTAWMMVFEMDCVAFFFVFGRESCTLARLKRKVWGGSNRATHFGPVTINKETDWKMSYKQKKELLGHRA